MTFNIRHLSRVLVAMISSIALLGWWTDHAALAAWLPGIANMTFNTALSFLLIAIACNAPNKRWQALRTTIVCTVAVLAALSLCQDLFGLDLGIDNLLIDAQSASIGNLHPGRMSPLTALGFLLCAAILLLRNHCERHRLLSLTHWLILLLGLLALTGIGMTVLMQDVPAGYTHLASISLFTAISFLLLSIALLRTFQAQGDISADLLLYSGIRLMYKLKYPQKFALISMIFTIPMAALMWDELDQHQRQVSEAKLKLIGINHIRETSKLIKAIPEHRGMSQAHLNDPMTFSASLAAKTAEIDRLFAENDTMDHLHANVIDVPGEWPGVLMRWRKIKADPGNDLESWRMHTEMIALLNKHLRDVGKQTLLAYDADPTVHNMLSLETELMPKLLEKLGQLRGQGVRFMARKQIGHSEQIMLASMTGIITLLLDEAKQMFPIGKNEQPSAAINDVFFTFTRTSKSFIAKTEQQLIQNKQFTISAEDYFALGTAAIRKGFDFSSSNLSQIEQLLHQRINASMAAQYNIKLTAMIVVLLLLFLFAAFYRSVMNTINSLDEVSRQMRQGDIDKLGDIPADDEMGHVVDSFNAVAEALVQANSQMSTVVDHAVDGIITIDDQSIIHSFNPASESMFGYNADEVIGQDIGMLMPTAYRSRHEAGLAHFRNSGEGKMIGHAFEVRGLKKSGDEFPMELSINAMTIDDTLMFIGMVHDTSARRELENQLRQAQKMEAVGALVGGVAHNFNNLLAGIVGKAYLAKRKSQHNPEVLSYLESIEAVSAQAGEMIKQLLTFAHKDFFRDQQDMPLDILIKEAFKTAKLGISEDIRLKLQVIDTNIMVHCDASQVQQVLMNMMNNARDALEGSADKQISVHLEVCRPDAAFFQRHECLAEGDYGCLSITDNGCGMDVETAGKIFDPFFTTKEVGKGTGLGLSTAFGTITSHHGAIEVDSKVGSGTSFRIYLPLIEGARADTEIDHKQQAVHSNRHETLLLVDDEPLLLHSMKEVLEELGYHVIKASNGVQGYEQFLKHQHRIDAMITDVVMPEMSGVEMFRQIRTVNSHLPTIFMTGYDQDKIHLLSDEQNNTLILSKPLQIMALSQYLESMLQH